MNPPLLNADIQGKTSTKPTLVLVHGVAGSLHIWDPIVDHMAARYQVARVDLLGYGHSPKPRVAYTPARHVASIRRTLQSRGLAPPYALVGLSMGATLVLTYAELYPAEVSSLVMIGYPYYPDRLAAERELAHNTWAGLTIRHPYIAQVYVPVVWSLGRVGIIPARAFAGIYSQLQARETLLNPYRVFRSTLINCMVTVDANSLLSHSVGIRRLFIHGEHDDWSSARGVEKAVLGPASTRFVALPGGGHNLVVLEPDKVVALIFDFLA